MPPREVVRLVIGSYEFTEVESMSIVSDLFAPAGSFRFQLGQKVSADPGARCAVWINGQIELTGIVDRLEQTMDESTHGWVATGKSLIGLVERSYITNWSEPPTTLAAAAKRYLGEIPFVHELPWTIEGDDPSVTHAGLDVGDTVFKVLNEFAQNRGLLFWARGNGEIVFGKAEGKGDPHYKLTSRQIKSRTIVQDISGLHSKILIVSDSDAGHQVISATNPSAPIKIPFAAAYNGHDGSGLQKQANEYTRQEKLQAFSMDCTVRGFSLNGLNWAVNKRVQVDDEVTGFSDTLLVRTREFAFDKTSGSTTKLSLSPILAEDVFKAYPRKRKGADAW